MLLESIGYSLAYAAMGIAILGVGAVALDLLTPGKLVTHIWEARSMGAALVLASGFLGLGGIVFTAIWQNAGNGFGTELAWTVAFGLLGVALQAVAYVLLDVVTPGKLGDAVCEKQLHPAAIVTAASQIAVSLVVIASIS